jgi:hypothetical protein
MPQIGRAFLSATLVAAMSALGPTVVALPAGARVPVIVELFTSEGCSSCPPADTLLAQLIATQPVDGALVIGLSEHVDYWDRLGWKDPFSDARYTRRQNDYAGHDAGDNIYTPQMVVDGAASFVGSDRAAALAAIKKAATQPKRAIQLSWPTASPGHLEIDVPGAGDRQASRVFLVVIESGLSSKVTRGENGGHTLTHDGVVRRLVELGQTNAAGAYHAVVPVPLDAAWHRSATRIVVLVQQPGAAITAAGEINVQ